MSSAFPSPSPNEEKPAVSEQDLNELVVEAIDVTIADELEPALDAESEVVLEALTNAAGEIALETILETGQETSDETPEEEVDPVEAFAEQMRRAPGDWYVIHSYAGYENKVKQNQFKKHFSEINCLMNICN